MDSRSKILPLEKLPQRIAELRSQNRCIVLTNGCFDILHAGHVRYLEEARALGGALVVAINDDESVRAIKEPGRPINPAADRAEVIAALEAVDIVTVFGDRTAEHVTDLVAPDVYVKGGDYSSDPDSDRFPAEGHIARRHGGEVRILNLVPGHSTTAVLGRLRATR